MKLSIEVDLTPEEARRFLGLPDVTEANQIYMDSIAKAMRSMTSIEQMAEYSKQLAPMGQMGLKLFQQMMERSAGAAMAGFSAAKAKKRNLDDEA